MKTYIFKKEMRRLMQGTHLLVMYRDLVYAEFTNREMNLFYSSRAEFQCKDIARLSYFHAGTRVCHIMDALP